jgi:hypothetical protein
MASHDSANVRNSTADNDNAGRAFGLTSEDDTLSAIDNSTGADSTRSVTGLGSLFSGAGGMRQVVGSGTGTPSRRRHNAKRSCRLRCAKIPH